MFFIQADEADQISELMNLQAGMRVADVGAGDGEWSEELARRVDESGHVYINEIDEEDLIKIRKRLERAHLGNMSIVVGEANDTRLPEACCDAILLRLVYHHMSSPDEMRVSLYRALRPDGLLLVIEKEERDGHGIMADQLVAEMTADGFKLVSQHPEWQGKDEFYAVVFTRRPWGAPESTVIPGRFKER
jgi:ubiquinone/menaquinone biosynthesis C-methylase UbiE